HDQCALLSAPWTESTTPLGDWGQMYRLKILSTMSDGPQGFIAVVKWATTVEVSREYKAEKLGVSSALFRHLVGKLMLVLNVGCWWSD
ncbi:hypothetical protein M9458_018298, partial [Cirrhinus mrigala]